MSNQPAGCTRAGRTHALSVATGISAIVMLMAMHGSAFAHPGHWGAGDFAGGASHPLLGFDHVLAMVAVGIWAAQLGGRALWALPVSFMAVMSVGVVGGISGVPLSGVEALIQLSVAALGIAVVCGSGTPVSLAAVLVGGFAIFHGHAHGTELPSQAQPLPVCAGILLATLSLHLVGIAAALLTHRIGTGQLTRVAGSAIAVTGFWMLAS